MSSHSYHHPDQGRFTSPFWTTQRTFISRYRQPHLTAGAPTFLHYTPERKTTWADLVKLGKSLGQVKTETVKATAKFLHPQSQEMVTEVEGVPIQGVVLTSKLGLNNHAAYWQAQHHLYQIYRKAGGHLPQDEIHTDQMPTVGDAIF